MNIRDLQYLIALNKWRHFSKAAQACHVSQPTLSMQIKKMEDYFGIKLIERHVKQVLLTEAGEKIVKKAQTILTMIDEIKGIAAAEANPYKGELRLGLIPTIAPYLLPRIIASFKQELPALKIYFSELQTKLILTELDRGELDAAILAIPIDTEKFACLELYEEPLYLAVPINHALAKRKHIALKDLQNRALMLLEEGHCLREQALEFCKHPEIYQEDFKATSLETLRHMVANNNAITLMPALAAKFNDKYIRYLPFTSNAPARKIALIYRKSSSKEKLFLKIAGIIEALKLI